MEQITCEFCGMSHHFDKDEVERLFYKGLDQGLH